MKRSALLLAIFAPALIAIGDEAPEGKTAEKAAPVAGRLLFDGKTLKGWEKSNYAGIGEIEVREGGALRIGAGEILSGVRYPKYNEEKLPRVNYEVTMKTRRIEGDDFFYCLTFPFHKEHATFVLGGWGGSVCGISSIDYMDAMENSTMTVREFVKEQWYEVRLVVSDHRFQGFIDGKRMLNVRVKDRKVGMRFGEIEESVPFGISTFRTTGEFKDVRLRVLTEDEVKAALKLDDEDEF